MTGLPALVHADLRGMATETLAPVDVAVIDSGIDSSHPDLRGRICSARRFRTEGETVVHEDLPLDSDNDAYGHGTAVASIIARMAPNARIHDFRVLELGNQGSGICFLEGLRVASGLGLKVLNMSLAVHSRFADELSAICEEAYYRGQILIAAKRNMPITNLGIPAEFSSTISVDCVEEDDPWTVSFAPGETIEFFAQGESVAAAAKGGGYTTLSGTSFATPVVSGLCALMAGREPGLRPFEAKSLLKLHAERCAARKPALFGARTPDETSIQCANAE